jgi:16S rRNA (cytosine967-C5)-methyltransferase
VLRHLTFLDTLSRLVFEKAGRARSHPVALVATHAVRVLGEEPAAVAGAVDILWKMAELPGNASGFLAAVSEIRIPGSLTVAETDRIALEYSYPVSIVSEWVGRFGAGEAEQLCRAGNEPGPACIRVNTLRSDAASCLAALAAEGVEARAGSVAPDALILPGRVNLPSLRPFRDGLFEMQDEGSQIVTLLFGPRPGELIVDACAGGGGKTLHAAALMENRGRILAADTDGRRLEQLRQRLLRAGAHIAEIVPPAARRKTLQELTGKADGVLIDAPCSGTGTFRRAPDAKLRYTERMSVSFAKTQRQLLEEHAPLVRPGGRLVYATCSLLRRENEDVVTDFLARHPEFSPGSPAEYLSRTGMAPIEGPALLLLPHRTGTDGFFAALLFRGGPPDR